MVSRRGWIYQLDGRCGHPIPVGGLTTGALRSHGARQGDRRLRHTRIREALADAQAPLVPVENPAALAIALDEVVSDAALRTRLGQSARAASRAHSETASAESAARLLSSVVTATPFADPASDSAAN